MKNEPNVTKSTNHGEPCFKLEYYPMGKRTRRFFPTRKAAEDFLSGQSKQALLAADWGGVSGPERAEMVAFWLKLKAKGVSPHACLESALKLQRKSPLLPQAVAECLKAKRGKRREVYLRQLAYSLNAFAGVFPNAMVHTVSSPQIEAWCNPLQNPAREEGPGNPRLLKPATANTRLAHLRVLLSFAVAQGWLAAVDNPAHNVTAYTIDQGRPRILSAQQARQLMEACLDADPALIPVMAGCLFSGVRPDEMLKVGAEQVKLNHDGEDFFDLPCAITKTHVPRLSPIPPNAKQWLELAAKAGVAEYQPSGWWSGHGRFAAVRRAAGLFDLWTPDVMRHSAVSYRLAQTKNENTTAYEMGHSVDILNRHYKNAVTKSQAELFFSVVPPADAEARIKQAVQLRTARKAEIQRRLKSLGAAFRFKKDGPNPLRKAA